MRPWLASGPDGPECGAFERFIELVSSQPAAARVCFVELHAAGQEGEAVADRGFEALTARLGAELAEGKQLSSRAARALVGGCAR